MAKKQKQEDAPAGSPAWMATFSDLMNLLLCFFVLLFSMSSVDTAKFEEVIASLQSSFSILSAGGASIGDGTLVSSGVSQLQLLSTYYNQEANSDQAAEEQENGETQDDGSGSATEGTSSTEQEITVEEAQEVIEDSGLSESEEMANEIENLIAQYGLQDQVEVQFNAQYVLLTLNGAILFDSGDASVKSDALPIIDKLGLIINNYTENIVEVEGHTDNVPIHSSKYESNDVLSMYRALSVATYLREITDIEDGHIKSSGRGDYVPIADNSTAEGRARNRRVEIKIYNSYTQTD